MLTINIRYENVLYELGRTAAYAGVKRDDYERLAVAEADSELLRQYCREACGGMVRSLKSMVDSMTDTDDAFVLTLRTSASFDTALVPAITGSLQSYVALTALTRWLSLSGSDPGRDFSALAAKMLDDARSQLMQRRKPVRRLGAQL